MAFRWKQQPINEIRENPNYADFDPMRPQPIQMQPVGLRGNEPWRQQYEMPQTQRAAYMDGYEAPQPVQDNGAEIAQLQEELASVEARIAEIDRLNPELARNPAAWEIAAKRAEVGDMSAYDSMVGRSAEAGQASGIENELYNAYKLIYGLDSQNDYEQGAYANQIETALRRADEWSARNPTAKMPPIYADLRARYDAWKAGKGNGGTEGQAGTITVKNADDTINTYTSKLKAKTYSRADEKGLQEWVDDNSNSPYAKAIQEFIDAHKNETVEARSSAAARKKAAKDKIAELQKLSVKEQERQFSVLDEKLKEDILKQAQWDTTNNRGLVWRR
jgi:hypothetical protein